MRKRRAVKQRFCEWDSKLLRRYGKGMRKRCKQNAYSVFCVSYVCDVKAQPHVEWEHTSQME